MRMKRFELKKSDSLAGWWVLTDTVNLVVIKFKEHEFNETQKITLLDEEKFKNMPDVAQKIATITREMGEYMFNHWYSIAMPTPVFEVRDDEERQTTFLLRNKYPRFKIEIQDECLANELGAAIKKAGEFLIKNYAHG